MFENLSVWSTSKAFIPHGTCLIWNSPLIWLHVASDALIASAYYSVPFALAYFVYRRTDLVYRWTFLLFAAYIFACGTTHLLDIWTLWHPHYVFQGFVKLTTALLSMTMVAVLWPLLPKALQLPSPAHLSQVNARLVKEVAQHEQTVANLHAEAAERRYLESTLRIHKARLKAILNTVAEGIVTINEQGFIETCNPAAAEMFCYPQDDLLGRNIHELMPLPDGVGNDDHLAAYRRTRQNGFPNHGRVVTAVRNDGSHFPVEIAVGEFLDTSGYHFTAILRDISERVAAEQALKESEQRLESALIGADLGLWDWNIKTGRVVFNVRWANMLGYALDEIEPNYDSWQNRIHPDDMPGVSAALNAHFEGKTTLYETEHRLLTKSGKWCWVLSRGKVFEWDDEGKPLRAAGTHMDISEKKSLEERLLRQQAELLHVQRLTTAGELAATMAHELNQPLSAITNYVGGATLRFADVLESHPPLGEIMEETLRLSHRAAEIIFGIRNLVRKHETGRQWTEIGMVIEEALSTVRTALEKRHIEVSVDIAADIPPVWGQRVHLQQLVLNLILNAMDAMDTPEVLRRELSLQVTMTEHNEVVLRVCDTGIGIEQSLAQQIFEPFISSKPDGIGLGLSICRTIAETHGGRISGSTDPDLGTCFTFTLPIDRRGTPRHATA